MIQFRRRADLALVETVVVAAASTALGAFILPATLEESGKFHKVQALAATQRIATGLIRFHQDTGRFPDFQAAGEFVAVLHGPGPTPSGAGWAALSSAPLSDFLTQNPHALPGWGGPYLSETLGPDPWGRAFAARVASFREGDPQRVWVLSAGPNGILETSAGDSKPGADDIGVAAR